ncbi:hypothetical protein [Desulforegula conservatrix]|uniref:hypothetical protein n=1 Tax=Desulforegula conservatrix TaxID=153026 RepID=UPI000404D87E|nr:hypothetical protein [Desulforegula conservatrix]
MKLIINLIISVFFTLVIAGNALCESGQDIIQVPAFGTSQIQKTDTMTARSEAVKKALSKSVETALFQMIPHENLASDFKNIESILTGDPAAYVRDYKVIGENTVGKEYRVIVNSNIIKAKLSAATQASGMESADSFPKVLILFSEKLNPADQASSWWAGNGAGSSVCEPEAAASLISKKLKASDHSQPALDETGKSVVISPSPTNEEALKLARAYKADMVIIGQISVSEPANSVSGGLKSFPAKVEARIINVADGTEIASASETASALNADRIAGSKQAAIQATKQTTAKLATAASAALKKTPQTAPAAAASATGLKTIPVSINGQDILGKMIPIRTAMTSIKGMKEVKTLEMNYSNAKLQASYDGDAATLSNELALKNFENFKMEISSSPESGIVINIPDQKIQ